MGGAPVASSSVIHHPPRRSTIRSPRWGGGGLIGPPSRAMPRASAQGVRQFPPSPGTVFPFTHTGSPYRGVRKKGRAKIGAGVGNFGN